MRESGKGFRGGGERSQRTGQETAKATEDISRKIEAIQTGAKAAMDAIASISQVINQVNDISSTIATAVEEQNATTNEMSRNVSEAARGSGEITSNIAGVAQAAESTSRGATETQNAAQLLVQMSTQLRSLVEQFKTGTDQRGSGHSTGAAVSLDFTVVKTAHRSWRLKLRSFLDGRENLTTEKLASHRDCQLGKWLYGDGGAAYGQLAGFQELEEKHKQMHGMVKEVVELKHAGKVAPAEERFLMVCQSADIVVALLTQLETQVTQPQGRAAATGR